MSTNKLIHNPLVSVIVPNFNHAQYLPQRLDSILNQTYSDYELIILDDCSSDESRQVISQYQKKYPQISNCFNKENSGTPFKQWNLGVGLAKGDFIWIAESDDFADVNFLSSVVPVLEKNPNVAIVHCLTQRVDENGDILQTKKNHFPMGCHPRWKKDFINSGDKEVSHFLAKANTIINVSGCLLRKTCYMESGWADETMKYCADWYLYIRMLKKYDIAYVAGPLNYFRRHNMSSYNQYFIDNTYIQELVKVYNFTVNNFILPVKVRIRIIRILTKLLFKKLFKGTAPSLENIFSVLKLFCRFLR